MMKQEYAEQIRNVIRTMGYKPDEKGVFHITPHRVIMDWNIWKSIAEANEPPFLTLDRVIPKLEKAYYDHWNDILSDKKELRSLSDGFNSDTDSDIFDIFLKEYMDLVSTKESWLEVPIWINLGLNVDNWSEYTANVTYPAYGWRDYEAEYKNEFQYSSIMWLTRRQGYRQRDLRAAQHTVDSGAGRISSDYLYSAAYEIWHELSIFNKLGFFLKIPFRDFLLLATMKRWGRQHKKWPGYVLLSKNSRCGFYSTSEGSGSLLGIKLEKDVKIPLCDADIYPDGTDGYALYEVYNDSNIWRPDCILYWGLPRQFRRDAAKWGIDELPSKKNFKDSTDIKR